MINRLEVRVHLEITPVDGVHRIKQKDGSEIVYPFFVCKVNGEIVNITKSRLEKANLKSPFKGEVLMQISSQKEKSKLDFYPVLESKK